MSSSTKTEISHDPGENEPRLKRSSTLNRKQPGSHSSKSYTSTEVKIPKIVKSSSSTENPNLETLYSPNKGIPKVIKIHEDSENSKSKSSSKISFWGSPDLSPRIEMLFNAMKLCNNSN
jgi:hypothetical protein